MEPALDRGMFRQLVKCLGVRVRCQDVTAVQKMLGKSALLSIRRVRNVIKDGDDHRVLLLDPSSGPQSKDEVSKFLSPKVQFDVREQDVEITYEHLQADEILRKLLPSDVEVPSGFETIGHIAHLNLRPEHEPYKRRIGQVILDKAANVKTVVNKTGIIESKFRTFPMEVLAGDACTVVDMRMNGLRFKFDFAKVYWNSRLSEEHERLVANRFKPQDIVVDGFCGVGPFALRAAKKGCIVLASDLNPESASALVENTKLNKIEFTDFTSKEVSTEEASSSLAHGKISAFNLDARQFIRFVFEGVLPKASLDKDTHLVMNLPASAIEFLDALKGLMVKNPPPIKLPFVHCYCFSSKPTHPERVADVIERIKVVLGIPQLVAEVREVRDVAPNKYMLCAHFTVPSQSPAITSIESDSAPMKRMKSDN